MFRAALILIFFAVLLFGEQVLLSSCSPQKKSASNEESKKKLPANLSLLPSSFHCETKVIEIDSLQLILVIRNMIQQGAALFYSVGIGDTIQARIYYHQRNDLSQDSITEMVIEERLKMNSEIPDFVVRQIIPGKK